MRDLIKAEYYKLKRLPSVHMIFLFAVLAGVVQGFSPCRGYQVYTISLAPQLFDVVLISVFTAAFLCVERSWRTIGNALLSGMSRRTVFFAKLSAYVPAFLVLILLPLAVSVCVATIRNGFGADGDALFFEWMAALFFYIVYRFFMAGLSIFAATVIQNPLGTLGISVAGNYLISRIKNPMGNVVTYETLIFGVIGTVISLCLAAFVFERIEIR